MKNSVAERQALKKMIAPGTVRKGMVWGAGGVIQVHVTRACDRACFHCTQGSNLGGKPVMITPEDFETAVVSLKDYWGVVGVFGGNPAIHPQFELLCEILREHIPFKRRGLWCNHPLGKGAIMRRTFNPKVCNLNVHANQEAWDEFVRDWPESEDRLKGLEESRHSPPYVAMKDVIEDENQRWKLIQNCDINKYWSAMICHVPGKGLRAFFCEIAGAMAMLHANDESWPDYGHPVVNGWWCAPMSRFADQARFYCHNCGIPLRRFGQLEQSGEFEEVSQTHLDIYKPKAKDRSVQLVTLDTGRRLEKVTDYIDNGHLK